MPRALKPSSSSRRWVFALISELCCSKDAPSGWSHLLLPPLVPCHLSLPGGSPWVDNIMWSLAGNKTVIYLLLFLPSFLHIFPKGIKKVPSNPLKERSHKAKFQLFPRIDGNNSLVVVAGGCSNETKPHELIASNVPISGFTYPYQKEIIGILMRRKVKHHCIVHPELECEQSQKYNDTSTCGQKAKSTNAPFCSPSWVAHGQILPLCSSGACSGELNGNRAPPKLQNYPAASTSGLRANGPTHLNGVKKGSAIHNEGLNSLEHSVRVW